MSGDDVSPAAPSVEAPEAPKGWRSEVKIALLVLGVTLLGTTGYQVVGWGPGVLGQERDQGRPPDPGADLPVEGEQGEVPQDGAADDADPAGPEDPWGVPPASPGRGVQPREWERRVLELVPGHSIPGPK